jgi:hypothetical protein
VNGRVIENFENLKKLSDFFLDYVSFLASWVICPPHQHLTPNPTVFDFPIVNPSPLFGDHGNLATRIVVIPHLLLMPLPLELPPHLGDSGAESVHNQRTVIRFVIDKKYASIALMDNTKLLDLK